MIVLKFKQKLNKKYVFNYSQIIKYLEELLSDKKNKLYVQELLKKLNDYDTNTYIFIIFNLKKKERQNF